MTHTRLFAIALLLVTLLSMGATESHAAELNPQAYVAVTHHGIVVGVLDDRTDDERLFVSTSSGSTRLLQAVRWDDVLMLAPAESILGLQLNQSHAAFAHQVLFGK